MTSSTLPSSTLTAVGRWFRLLASSQPWRGRRTRADCRPPGACEHGLLGATVSTTWRSSPVDSRGLPFSTAIATKIQSGGSRTFRKTPLVVTTGGGGKHFYYRHSGAEVRNRSRLFGRRIDLRADGGVVIAPPSIHPESRQAYEWVNGFGCQQTDVPPFDPGWIADREPTGRPQPFCARSVDTTIRNGLAYIRRIRAIAGNGGHNATFRAACKLRNSGLTAGEAFQAILLWNETNASPPWSSEELAHKVDDAYRDV